MPALSKRVQIVSALIREAVRKTYLSPAPATKPLEAVRRMAAMQLPVSDWEQMEQESVSGGCLE